MKKYLRVSIDNGSGQSVVVYEELDGDESESDREESAADIFSMYCSYGHEVVDESDVPEDERG